MNGRKIFAQGHLDGACFLYAIANGVGALTGKEITRAQWRTGVTQLPFRLDDFLAGPSTSKLDLHPGALVALCNSFLTSMKAPVTARLLNKPPSTRLLARAIDGEQVVLADINRATHWVAFVEIAGVHAYAACSAEALWGKRPYTEAESPIYKRTYNVSLSYDDFAVCNTFSIGLTRGSRT